MNLKELQNMIKEEFDAYMGEAEDNVDVAVSDADVDVDAEMGDEEGEDPEAMLRNIYDMLKAKFEAEDEMDGEEAPEMDEMDEMDVEEDVYEAKDSDLDEASSMGFGDKGNKKTSGANTGYTNAKALQERFQKLANIIK